MNECNRDGYTEPEPITIEDHLRNGGTLNDPPVIAKPDAVGGNATAKAFNDWWTNEAKWLPSDTHRTFVERAFNAGAASGVFTALDCLTESFRE